MDILLCIDDTDSLYKGSTGELAEGIASSIEELGFGKCYAVTRHQLLLHSDIPYTSHNSSMCFRADIKEDCLQNVIDAAKDFLVKESDIESDPGLCVVNLNNLSNMKKLIDFGYLAKKKVLVKKDAYDLAQELNIHLSEHGGTGQGVIGALAGAGLRLDGNDGWLKGSIKINLPRGIINVASLCSYKNIDRVRSLNGRYLEDDEIVLLGKMVKTVLINGEFVLLVDEVEVGSNFKWKTCSKQQLQKYEETNSCGLLTN